MSKELKIGNRVIHTPIAEILKVLKSELTNGKLQAIYDERNNDIAVTCPHHKFGKEENPSCNIYVGNSTPTLKYGTVNCLTCHFNGTFSHFVAECMEISDEQANEWLLAHFKSDRVTSLEFDLEPIELPKVIKPKYLNESILETFQSWHPYMEKRKLTRKVCETFKVKYDTKTKCIVFPVWDIKGNLLFLTRRSVESKKFIIDKSVDKPVYLLNYLISHNINEAWVFESQINTLTGWTHGLPSIGLFGTGDKYQYEILNKSPIRIYHLCFDGDEAGDKGVKRFLQNVRKDVIIDVVPIPRGKDFNDLSYEEVENLITTYN